MVFVRYRRSICSLPLSHPFELLVRLKAAYNRIEVRPLVALYTDEGRETLLPRVQQ